MLKETLKSFYANLSEIDYNHLARVIIIEDSLIGRLNLHLSTMDIAYKAGRETKRDLVKNDLRLGQIKSIDRAYSMVDTPYIFHCEDDWEFYRTGFIEESMKILETEPDIMQVWLRDRNDTNGHPIIWKENYGIMKTNYKRTWHGFSFNPGLRRLSDYQKIAPYSQHTEFNFKAPWESEIAIGKLYHQMGMKAAILPNGYVKHIGENRGIRS